MKNKTPIITFVVILVILLLAVGIYFGVTKQSVITYNDITLKSFSAQFEDTSASVIVNWKGGKAPYTFEIENYGDGEDLYEENINTNFIEFTHDYQEYGTYELSYYIYDEESSSNNYCSSEIIELKDNPEPMIKLITIIAISLIVVFLVIIAVVRIRRRY